MGKYKVNINFLNTGKIKVITSSKTKELLKAYKNGDKNAREEVALGNLKLVLSVVKRFFKKNINLDDIFQVGFIGLLKAIDNFDLSLDVAFSTYAVPMIEGEIRRYLRDDSSLRISRQIRDLSYKILKSKELSQEYSYIPNLDDLSKELKEDKTKIIEAMDANIPLTSLDEPLYQDNNDSLSLEDTLYSYEEERKQIYAYLYEGIEALSEIEKKVIIERYFKGKSQLDLAKTLNISQAQVSRIEKAALKSLKKYV